MPSRKRPALASMSLVAALGSLAALPAPAAAKIFGSTPIPISVGPGGEAANGPSGGASVSGDNRLGRLVGFHSSASNLVGGDSNGASDVFVWSRPRGGTGLLLTQPARPSGNLVRVSVSASGAEANGPSLNPSVDGSIQRGPRCVAFQSSASNLSPADRDGTSDIFVRDLAAGRTHLVSRGIGGAAGNPSIDGSCRNVAFQASGRVYTAPVRSGSPRAIGGGSSPDYSLDGTAVVWQRGGAIAIRRRGVTSRVASGRGATVSDVTRGGWGVAFTSGSRAYLKTIRARGGPVRTTLVSRGCPTTPGGSSSSGGVTAYAPERGIVTFVQAGSHLCYFNKNTGNTDDLAHSSGPIFDVSTSSRANFVAFTSTGAGFPYDGNGGMADVFFKHLVDGQGL